MPKQLIIGVKDSLTTKSCNYQNFSGIILLVRFPQLVVQISLFQISLVCQQTPILKNARMTIVTKQYSNKFIEKQTYSEHQQSPSKTDTCFTIFSLSNGSNNFMFDAETGKTPNELWNFHAFTLPWFLDLFEQVCWYENIFSKDTSSKTLKTHSTSTVIMRLRTRCSIKKCKQF